MYSFYDGHGKECMCDMTEEQGKELICDDFSCLFAGTEYCVNESCGTCELNWCRGCRHLKECASEGMIN